MTTRLAGEPLGMKVTIFNDHAQLAHVYQSQASPRETYAGERGRFVAVGAG